MKKISHSEKKWHRIRAKKIASRRFRDRRGKGRPLAVRKTVGRVAVDANLIRRVVPVPAPKVFNVHLRQHRPEMLQFLRKVRLALGAGSRVVIGFDQTTDIHPCAMLVFMANVDVWMHKYPGMLTARKPADDVVEQLFQHFGLLQNLGVLSDKVAQHDKVKYWHYYSGEKVTAEKYRELMASITGRVHQSALFGGCLNEAVTNAVAHAYEFDQEGMPPSSMRKWWMFSQKRDGNLFVAIYDAGVSIPNSLMNKPEWRDYLRRWTGGDGRMIEVAVGSNRSRTKLPHRGKGLPEMLEFSKGLSSGGLAIMSRSGCFSYQASNGVERRWNYKHPLRGTLVLWTIPFVEDMTGGENDQHS